MTSEERRARGWEGAFQGETGYLGLRREVYLTAKRQCDTLAIPEMAKESKMLDEIGTALLILGGAALLGWYFYMFFTRSRSFVANWAEEKGCQLLHAESRLFRRGPFFWSGKGQAIYRVAVLDEQGHKREGWVRCGHWLLGMAVEHVEARLDS